MNKKKNIYIYERGQWVHMNITWWPITRMILYDARAASTIRTAMQTTYSTPQCRYDQNKSKCKLHT